MFVGQEPWRQHHQAGVIFARERRPAGAGAGRRQQYGTANEVEE